MNESYNQGTIGQSFISEGSVKNYAAVQRNNQNNIGNIE